MLTLSPRTAVGRLAAEHSSAPRLFDQMGIDYCCGGKQTLADACTSKNLDANAVLLQISDGDKIEAPSARDWNAATLTELADHIESTHHAWLKETLPWLSQVITKVERAHGKRNEKLSVLRVLFEDFKTDMLNHMTKEEIVLFPMCRELDSMKPWYAHDGSIGNPIRVMMAEHEHAGEALEQMRDLTSNYMAPIWACGSYRAMLATLRDLEADMHQHVHLENNILFPRAEAASEPYVTPERRAA